MNVLITQSNYIPWKGYIDSIALADKFIVYDDMQYTKRDWRNRNLIKTQNGLKWLSIPVEVKGKFHQKINETKISDHKWNLKHLNILKENYKASSHYNEVIEMIEPLYMHCNFEFLTDINRYFLDWILTFFQIKTKILDSRLFELTGDRTEKLLNLCVENNAKHYITGPAAKEYIDESKFNEKGIDIKYLDYTGYKEYNQLFGDFEHSVSIFDLIFNEGLDAKLYLKKV